MIPSASDVQASHQLVALRKWVRPAGFKSLQTYLLNLVGSARALKGSMSLGIVCDCCGIQSWPVPRTSLIASPRPSPDASKLRMTLSWSSLRSSSTSMGQSEQKERSRVCQNGAILGHSFCDDTPSPSGPQSEATSHNLSKAH